MLSKSKKTTVNLKQHLGAYSAAAGALLVAVSGADAKVQYTNIDPDKMVSTHLDGYYLDFDDDGINEFFFIEQIQSGNTNYGSPFVNYGALLLPFNSNSFVGSATSNVGFPTPIDSPSLVGSSAMWQQNFGILANLRVVGSNTISLGNWFGAEDKYVGLNFMISGKVHYGWIRLDVDILGKGFTVKDYAWEDEAETAIAVGDTGPPAQPSGVSVIEEPDVSIYSFNNTIFFNSTDIHLHNAIIEVLDLSGRLILNERYVGGQKRIPMNTNSTGTYIVAIRHEKDVIQKKVFIQ